LPDKFGFVLDIAGAPHLRAASGDVRIERTKEAGHFWVYADGASTGWRGPQAKVIKAAMDLAKWFVEKGGMSNGRGRMRTLMQSLPTMPEDFTTHLQLLPPAQMPNLGLCDQGLLVGLRFGNLSADLLDILADQGELRLTPWRMVLVAGAKALAAHPDLIIDPRDPSLRIEACIGAPACNQAHGTTYDMAQRLTHILPVGRFAHISGCAKGCARTGNCDLTIVAQEGGYAWGKKVCADDIMGPALSKDFLLKDIQATFESPNNV
jgi:precorrin-3B synthase